MRPVFGNKKWTGSLSLKLYPYLSTCFMVKIPLFTFFDDIRIHSMAKLNLVVGSMLGPPNMSQIMWSACLNRRATRGDPQPASLARILTEAGSHRAGGHFHPWCGDVPDNLQPFAGILPSSSRIRRLQVQVIALGIAVMTPSARAARRWIGCWRVRCQPTGDLLEIDVTQHEIPEDAAETWIHDWMILIG